MGDVDGRLEELGLAEGTFRRLSGRTNITYLYAAGDGEHIVKILNKDIPAASRARERMVLDLLYVIGLLPEEPRLLSTHTDTVMIVPYFPGETRQQWGPDIVSAVIRHLCHLHRKSSERVDELQRISGITFSPDVVDTMLSLVVRRLDTFTHDYKLKDTVPDLSDCMARMRRRLQGLSDGAKGALLYPCLCHCDVHHDNVIIRGAEVALIDWEYAAVLCPLVELVGLFCESMGFDVDVSRMPTVPERQGILELYVSCMDASLTETDERLLEGLVVDLVRLDSLYWARWARYMWGNAVPDPAEREAYRLYAERKDALFAGFT